MVFALPHLHFLPAEIAVDIVDQKRNKAHDNGNIANVGYAGKHPQNNQHHVVGSVSKGKERASAESEIDRNKAGGNGEGAGDDVGGIEMRQDEIKHGGNNGGANPHPHRFRFADGVNLNLRFVALIRVAEPRDEGKDRHRHGHPEIGDHFAVISKAIGNNAIQQAEHHHQHLPERVTFGIKDQRGNADEGGDQSQNVFTVKKAKGAHDQQDGRRP